MGHLMVYNCVLKLSIWRLIHLIAFLFLVLVLNLSIISAKSMRTFSISLYAKIVHNPDKICDEAQKAVN